MTRRRPVVAGQPWQPDTDETCPTCGSDRILTGPVGARHERLCCACGERYEADQ